MQYYRSSNFNFNKNGDIKLQPIDGILKVELNTILNEIEFELPYDEQKRWTKIEEWGVVKCKVFYSKNKQLYRIYNISKGMFSLKIKARHIFFDLVKHNILDTRAVNCNGQQALDKILDGTKFTGHSDILITNTSYFQVTNAIQAINGENENSFRTRWGGEMLFDNFDIYINRRIGKDYGVRINYSINMEDVNLDIDRDNIITRAYPRAYDGVMLPEKYVDSPLINKYPLICEDYIDMSDLKLKDPNLSDSEGFDTEEELYNAMRERTKKCFEEGIDKPKVAGNVKLVNLENTLEYKEFKNLVNIGIGDTVTARHKELDIDMKTRCISIEWNIVTEKYENIEFGDIEVNYFEKQDIAREQLENILNNNGTVNPQKLQGVINALNTKYSAMRNAAQPQHVLAMLFEDKVKGSKTYGACAIGSMGLMIASERTPNDKDWNWNTFIGGGFAYADWLIGKLKTVLIENMDGSFQMDLNKPGGMLFRNNGVDAIKIENNMVQLFNWGKNGELIGGLMSLLNNSDPTKPIVALGNALNSATMITYPKEGTNTHPSYITFDKFNIMGDKEGKPIRIYEDIDFRTKNLYNAVLSSLNDKCFIYTNNEKTVIRHDDVHIKLENGKITLSGNLILDGVIKNTSGNVVFDPNNVGIGGGADGDWQNGVISSKGLLFVKQEEGFAEYGAYFNGENFRTGGYGVTENYQTAYYRKLEPFPTTEENAAKVTYELLTKEFGIAIKNKIKAAGITNVKQHHFDVWVSLGFNYGLGGLSSLNAWQMYLSNPNDIANIANAIRNLNANPGRRQREADLFETGNYPNRQILKYGQGGSINGYINGNGWLPPRIDDTCNFKKINNDYGTGWIIPVTNAQVTALFGHYPSGAPHSGTDFGVPVGTPVRASKSGTVIKKAELDYSYGHYLFIDHGGGLVTIYAHNSQLLVNQGDTVKAGQIIAKSGNTGNSTGPHSHIELRYNGTPVNFAPSLRIGDVV